MKNRDTVVWVTAKGFDLFRAAFGIERIDALSTGANCFGWFRMASGIGRKTIRLG